MTFSNTAAVAALIWSAVAPLANAACMTLDREKTPGQFETMYVCNNTLAKPNFTIVRHFIGDDAFSVFNFDPMGANIVCTDYELAGRRRAECLKAGVRPLAPSYKVKNFEVRMSPISTLSGSKLEALYRSPNLFAYPDSPEAVVVEKCFVHVAENYVVTFGYDRENYMDLSTCLIQFEEHLKHNKKLLLRLF